MKDFFGSYVRELGISFHSLAPILFLISQLLLNQTKHKTVLLYQWYKNTFHQISDQKVKRLNSAVHLHVFTYSFIYLFIYFILFYFIYLFIHLFVYWTEGSTGDEHIEPEGELESREQELEQRGESTGKSHVSQSVVRLVC